MSADWKPSEGYVAQRMAPDGYLVEATPPAAWDEYAAREAERLWKLPGMPRAQLVATLHCALVEAMRVAVARDGATQALVVAVRRYLGDREPGQAGGDLRDVWRAVEAAEAEIAAPVAPAAPVATLHDDGYWTAPAGRDPLRPKGQAEMLKLDVYAAPVAPICATPELAAAIAEWKKNPGPLVAQPLTAAARDVLAERRRQIEVDGYKPAEDDEYMPGRLAQAAACYAYPAIVPQHWPWGVYSWKPTIGDPRRMLIKSAALMLAEIERIDRAAAKEGGAP